MDEGGQSHTMRCSIPKARIGHQEQTNATPDPCETEMNAPCQGDANMETRGEETDLHSLPGNGELQQRGVSKRQKESTLLARNDSYSS